MAGRCPEGGPLSTSERISLLASACVGVPKAIGAKESVNRRPRSRMVQASDSGPPWSARRRSIPASSQARAEEDLLEVASRGRSVLCLAEAIPACQSNAGERDCNTLNRARGTPGQARAHTPPKPRTQTQLGPRRLGVGSGWAGGGGGWGGGGGGETLKVTHPSLACILLKVLAEYRLQRACRKETPALLVGMFLCEGLHAQGTSRGGGGLRYTKCCKYQ